MTTIVEPLTATVAVPIGMKHTRAKWGPACGNWGELTATTDSDMTVIEHGQVCGECGQRVEEDRRPVVTGALQVIDLVLENRGTAIVYVGLRELQEMVDLFEQGAKWVLSQQEDHARDLGIEMGPL